MTREEAIAQIEGLKKYCEDMADSDESGSYVFDLDVQALDLALSALRPVSRETGGHPMDYDKLIGRLYTKQLSYAAYTNSELAHVLEDASTALSELHAENEKLWAELEQVKGERDEAVRGAAERGAGAG